MDTLHIITPISNPRRYASRYRLTEYWKRHCERHDAKLYIGEVQQGERDFAVTEAANSQHMQLRTKHELWHKENISNLVVQHRLPRDAKYIAFVDGDVQFVREDWQEETRHMLQHHPIVQMFSHAIDLGPDMQPIQNFQSFGSIWRTIFETKSYGYPHTGFAWAMTREAFEILGGLIDFCILGAGDYHMAWGLVGMMERAAHEGISCTESYMRMNIAWQQRAVKGLHKDVGFVKGTLLHHFHGKKRDRGYNTRGQILHRTKFDPIKDLHRDSCGLWQLRPDAIDLRDSIRQYFSSRNEDSIDL